MSQSGRELVEIVGVALIALADRRGGLGQYDQKLLHLRCLGCGMRRSLLSPLLQLIRKLLVSFLHQGRCDIAGETAFQLD